MIVRDVRAIVRRSHALHGAKRLHELPELRFNPAAIYDGTFNRCWENGIHPDASMTDFLR